MSPGTFSRRAWSLATIYIFARVRIKKDGPLSDRPVKFHDSFYKLLHFFLLPAIFCPGNADWNRLIAFQLFSNDSIILTDCLRRKVPCRHIRGDHLKRRALLIVSP